jgi:hypothetical protein
MGHDDFDLASIFDYSDGEAAVNDIMDLPPDEAAAKLADILQQAWRGQVLALAERIVNDLNSDDYLRLESADARLARLQRNIHHLINGKLRIND